MKLNKEEMKNETDYQIAKSILRDMVKEKLITEDEYHLMLEKLIDYFPSIFGRLFVD